MTSNTAAQKPEFKMTKREEEVKGVYDLMIDEGIDVTTAARYSVSADPKARTKFVEWLSDGTLTKVKGKVIVVEVAPTA